MRRDPLNPKFNPKRRLDPAPHGGDLEQLASQVSYGGNPEHKRNPGDFGLTPPASPRPDKTLCDEIALFRRAQAMSLLQEGARRGLISLRRNGDFPQNIWAVTDNGQPVEAQLDNAVQGTYHGYPMPDSDPLAAAILNAWQRHDR